MLPLSHSTCSVTSHEQVFRFNNRATKDNPLNHADRFSMAVRKIIGKRLTFAELTGKTAAATPSNPYRLKRGRKVNK